MTPPEDRELLLRIARAAIVAHVGGVTAPSPPLAGAAARWGGVFVTLHVKRELRGCIGHIEADEAIGKLVARCAVASCSADSRFSPLSSTELPDLHIELSLLGALESIAGIEEIEIGSHGLVVEREWLRGLLLPQVAIEWGWDRETFLAHACEKAGLPRDAWCRGATLWRFEAEVFGEGE